MSAEKTRRSSTNGALAVAEVVFMRTPVYHKEKLFHNMGPNTNGDAIRIKTIPGMDKARIDVDKKRYITDSFLLVYPFGKRWDIATDELP